MFEKRALVGKKESSEGHGECSRPPNCHSCKQVHKKATIPTCRGFKILALPVTPNCALPATGMIASASFLARTAAFAGSGTPKAQGDGKEGGAKDKKEAQVTVRIVRCPWRGAETSPILGNNP